MDETRIQCNKEAGKKPAVNLSSGSYAVPHAKNSRQRSFTIPKPGMGISRKNFWRNSTDTWSQMLTADMRRSSTSHAPYAGHIFIDPMRKRNRSVRRSHGPSLMPFGRGLRKSLRWLPQMRNSPRHSDILKTRRDIWKHFWKTGACRSLTFYVKQISSRSPQQGGHGFLLTLQVSINDSVSIADLCWNY